MTNDLNLGIVIQNRYESLMALGSDKICHNTEDGEMHLT